MSRTTRRFAVATAAVGTCGAVIVMPANAAIKGAVSATPGISPVSCGAPDAWLKLQDASGENCYTGNGSEPVFLAGVTTEQITGIHHVCLYAAQPSTTGCATGPASISIHPAAHVEQITITTP